MHIIPAKREKNNMKNYNENVRKNCSKFKKVFVERYVHRRAWSTIFDTTPPPPRPPGSIMTITPSPAMVTLVNM